MSSTTPMVNHTMHPLILAGALSAAAALWPVLAVAQSADAPPAQSATAVSPVQQPAVTALPPNTKPPQKTPPAATQRSAATAKVRTPGAAQQAAQTPVQPRWWAVPLADRLNRSLDEFGQVITQEPLADRLNRGLDGVFSGMSLLFKAPAGQDLAWWEKPLADRLNAQIDQVGRTIAGLEARDVVRAARVVGLNGPEIWPSKVLSSDPALLDPQAPLSLLQAWQAARVNDPGLRAARAALAGARERVPQARAQLLPQIQLGVTRLSNDLSRDGQNVSQQQLRLFDRYPSANDTLSLRQPVFRIQQAVGVKQAQAVEREAEAIFAGEEQAFSVRVAVAYLETLLAQDTITLMESQRQFLEMSLLSSRRALESGFGTRTDIDAAQARLDLNRAQMMQARQQLDFARRQLQAWVAQPFGSLLAVDGQQIKQLNLAATYSLDEWLAKAERGSPEVRRLLAQHEGMSQEMNKARAGHLPTVDFIAQMQRSRSENTLSPQSRFQNSSMGFQVNVPLYSGGYVNSVTRQVSAELERLEESLSALRADIGVRVHREYRGVIEGRARVEALEVAVRSAEVALDSARKSMAAGVRTQVDVLNAEQQLSQARRDLSESRYAMLAAMVRLRSLAGESDETLMARLNTVFVHP
jgi:outer membrane protein/protease secretion system outer membrane protein